jgi:L-lactate permease
MGNMICINNILGAKAVMNLTHVGEGEFIRRTAPVAFLMAILSQAFALIFTLGGVMPDHPFAIKY